MESAHSKLMEREGKKEKEGKRECRCFLRYVWVFVTRREGVRERERERYRERAAKWRTSDSISAAAASAPGVPSELRGNVRALNPNNRPNLGYKLELLR